MAPCYASDADSPEAEVGAVDDSSVSTGSAPTDTDSESDSTLDGGPSEGGDSEAEVLWAAEVVAQVPEDQVVDGKIEEDEVPTRGLHQHMASMTLHLGADVSKAVEEKLACGRKIGGNMVSLLAWPRFECPRCRVCFAKFEAKK